MLLGLLVSERSLVQLFKLNRPSYLQFLASAAFMEDINVIVFAPSRVNWADCSISGLVFNRTGRKWHTGCTSFPDVIYDRATLDYRKEEKIAAKNARNQFKKEYHIPFINNINFFNKWKTYQALSHYPDIFTFLPDTQLYNITCDLASFLNKYGTVYVKPCRGSNGRNVFQVKHSNDEKFFFSYRKKSENFKALLTLEEFHSNFIESRLADKSLIIQQGINLSLLDGRPFDIRVRTQKNGTGKWKIAGKWVRIAAPGSVVTNSSSGGGGDTFTKIMPLVFPKDVIRINSEIDSLVYKSCEILEESFGQLGDLGFDIALDHIGKVWILEVNAKPTNIWHFDRRDINRFINPVRYAKFLWKKKQKEPLVDG